MFDLKSSTQKFSTLPGQVRQAMMLPTAILPLAGLLLMAGDLLARTGVSYASILTSSGFVLFEMLPILIAICLAVAISAEQPGLAAFSGAVAFLILNRSALTLAGVLNSGRTGLADFSMGIAGGFFAGLLAGFLQNHCKKISLPKWLGFFSGKYLSPVLTALAAFVAGLVCGALWYGLDLGFSAAAVKITEAGAGGAFIFGFLNRLLLPLGLDQVLNQEIWYKFGDYTSQSGILVQGDLNRFLAGDPTAGRYVSGFFPMMIFAVPAIVLCLLFKAKKDHRIKLIGYFAVVGLVSLISGVPGPLEYLLLFTAPVLFLIYTLLYGLSLLICYQMQVLCGFSFSAGLTDYMANWPAATRPELIWMVGLVMAALSFAAFYLAITFLKLQTPGRELDADEHLASVVPQSDQPVSPDDRQE